ncbi:MAG: YhcH/YjgK/YiaL family protein [Oscillospiraceae bacterium]
MIYDTLENADLYGGMGPKLQRALRYLRETDFSKIADGRQEIDGTDVFANVMTYTTQPGNELPEAHRNYIDVQYLISGEESIGVGQLAAMTELVEEKPQNDCYLYRGKTEGLTIGNGRFLAVWPQDAHAPGRAVGAPAEVRKCVVKVHV